MRSTIFARAVLGICLCVTAVIGGPDPPREALDKAKADYQTAITAAIKGLLDKFDERIKMAADAGNLDAVLRLRAEKKAFADDDTLPKVLVMKTATGEYQGAVKAARKKLGDTYEITIKEYTKKLDTDRAEEVRNDYVAFKAAPTRAAATASVSSVEVDAPIAPGIKMSFCWIPAGKATLGSPAGELGRTANEPEHEFTTSGFWLGRYEVTQAEWAAVMGQNPSTFDGRKPNQARGMDTSRFPVEDVSYDNCQQFLTKLNSRPEAGRAFPKAGKFVLPHEDEWEYACRGGKGNARPFYFDGELNGRQANYDGSKSGGLPIGRPVAVGSYAKGFPHPWGLCDMHGNVWEWCATDRPIPAGHRVIRGGCFFSFPDDCRAANRNLPGPETQKYFNLGFRACYRPN
jgi:formylglycine-generating enzyme required for sulfatase activity